MGINTVRDPITGELEAQWSQLPTYQRPPFTASSFPVIQPVSPSTDIREGATVQLGHGTYSMPILSYVQTLRRYADGDDPLTATAIETTVYPVQLAADALTQFAVPTGVADCFYVLSEAATEVIGTSGGRVCNATSETIDIIAAEFSPAFTVTPAVTGTATLGSTLTCDGGTATGTPAPDDTFQWGRDGVAIAGATSATYVIVAADYETTLSCAVTAANTTGSVTAVSNGTFIPLTYPAFAARTQFTVADAQSTTGIIGSCTVKVGTAAGGVAVSYGSDFTLHWQVGTAPGGNINATITAGNTVTAGTGTFTNSTAYAAGTPLYGLLFWRHVATNKRATATDQTDTATVSGITGPYPLVIAAGGTGTNPIAALGTPSSNFVNVAVAARLSKLSNDGKQMYYQPDCQSMFALGIAVLKGDTSSARTRALAQIRQFISTDAQTPFLCGGYSDHVSHMLALLFLCFKLTPTAWALLTAQEQARINVFMKVLAISDVFVASDSNPQANNNGRGSIFIRGWPTVAGQGENQKTTAPNQSLCGPCGTLITMAWFGGPAQLKTFLSSSATLPADIRAEILTTGLTSACNPYKTLNWISENYTGSPSLEYGAQSSDAPTDAQIVAAISGNPKWFGIDLSNYHRILAGVTCKASSYVTSTGTTKINKPWIAYGVYGTDPNSGASGINGNPVVIAPGWGDIGLTSVAGPATSITSGNSTDGRFTTTRTDLGTNFASVPGLGQTGAPMELFSQVDANGKRSDLHYVVEGMRMVIGSHFALHVTGLLDQTNADFLEVLPVMDRGVRLTKFAHEGGWQAISHGGANRQHYPNSEDYQIGNLYETWTLIFAPAVGL